MNHSFIIEAMARLKPNLDERRTQLIAAATQVFTRNGFRQTQMSDIAREMGVSVGSLYNWVDSKETLFAWALAAAFEVEVDRSLMLDPVVFLQLASQDFTAETWTPRLDEALDHPPEADFGQELGDVIGEMFDFTTRFGTGIRLIEASTVDYPELAALYFDQLRAGYLDKIERYLKDRFDHGVLAPTQDLSIMMRSLVELIAWWGLHRERDPAKSPYDPSRIRSEVVGFAVRGLIGKE
ncbi:MAG: TetR/AcrR family transcriptional regulator [Alphaproteobacteria bacterium]|nr:MAG: TetR/AcrR family transcriptional regulator [Alphaproteobacteria bacterium]